MLRSPPAGRAVFLASDGPLGFARWWRPPCSPRSVVVVLVMLGLGFRWRRRRHGIRSSRALPHLVGAPLRRRRRARGGCAPGMELLYRSRSPAVHRPRGMVSSSASRIQDKKAASGRADGWRVDRARVSRGGFRHRRRVPVQGRRGLGCVPGRCGINVCFFYCGYFQSLMAIGLLRPWVGGGASPAMAGDSDDVRLRPAEDLESYVHFLCSLGASVQNDRYSCLRYLSGMYLYVYVSFVRFP